MSDYTYDAIVRAIHDGDTVTLDVDLGFSLWIHGLKIRLYGINAPELATPEGKKSKEALENILPINRPIVIETVKDKAEKYGRILGKIIPVPGKPTVNDQMVTLGAAKPYFGVGPKPV